jgi:hypothetical protein
MYQLICMAFDGDYVTERHEFESIEDAWEYSNNLGSKWWFFPFHFVIKSKTIKGSPINLEYFNNKRIKTVSKIFNRLSNDPELQGVDCDGFTLALIDEIVTLSIIN